MDPELHDEADPSVTNALKEDFSEQPAAAAPVREEPTLTPDGGEVPSSEKDDFVGEFVEPDYKDILDDRERDGELALDDDELPPQDPKGIPTSAAKPTEPAPTEPTQPPAVSPSALEPAKGAEIPTQPVAPTPSAEPTRMAQDPTAQPQLSPEEMAARQQQLLDEAIATLSEHYKLSPEEAERIDGLEGKPSEYLPRLLARAQLNGMLTAQAAITQQMPQMVESITRYSMEKQRAVDLFYARWPELKGQDEVVARSLSVYRQTNPDAPLEVAIEQGGLLAMISLGRNPLGNQPAPRPQQPSPQDLAPPRPMLPGSGGARAPARPATYEEQVYSEILEEEKNYGRG